MTKITIELDKSIKDKYETVSLMTKQEFAWLMQAMVQQQKNNNTK
jgi:hypothetical protein